VAGTSAVPGFQEKFFHAGEIAIHYAEGLANGPPLVLLHGLARDWKSFSPLLPQLAALFRVFALDLRGHGKSSRSPREYRISDYALDVSGFMQSVLPSGAAIFGHSLGGEVAMCVAADGHRNISALVVGDPAMSPASFSNSLYHSLFAQLRDLVLCGGSQQELAHGMAKIEIQIPGFEKLRIEELPGNSEAVLMEWARGAMQADPDALAVTLDGSSFEGLRLEELLPKITCPTLLLQGNPELDALLSDDDVQTALKWLPKGEHIKFPLLGHALFMQQPQPVLKAVTTFLAKHTIKSRV
jgi:pimeloyl-ACP methyl ester carboxylesterase